MNRDNYIRINENSYLTDNSSEEDDSEIEYNLDGFKHLANNHHLMTNNVLEENENMKENVEIDFAHHNSLNQDLLTFEKDIENSLNELKESEQDYLLFLDSKDRILNGENTTFNFQVIVDEKRLPGITNVNDISKIELIDVQIPNFYSNLKETLYLQNQGIITSNKNTTTSNSLRLERLSDINYLFLSIDEYSNTNMIGTNSAFRNKSFILKKDGLEERSNKNSGSYEYDGPDLKFELGNINNSVLADTDKNIISYIPIGDNVINMGDKENKLKNFNISFKKYDNISIDFLNDDLTINDVTIYSNKIKIGFTTIFSSEEYALGDKILIKPNTINFLNTNNLDLESLKLFLERKEGHSIIQHFGDSDNTPISNTKFFKAIYIPTKFSFLNNVNTDPVSIFQPYDFGLNLATPIYTQITDNINNKLINIQNQILVTLKITTTIKSL